MMLSFAIAICTSCAIVRSALAQSSTCLLMNPSFLTVQCAAGQVCVKAATARPALPPWLWLWALGNE